MYKNDKRCTTPHVTEDEIKEEFLSAFNTMMSSRDEIIANCQLAQNVLGDCTELDAELEKLHREIQTVAELAIKKGYL